MFKRKQRPTIPTTPPNFLDLRNPVIRPHDLQGRPGVFSDISMPSSQSKWHWPTFSPIHVAVATVVCVGAAVLVVAPHQRTNPLKAVVASRFTSQMYYPAYLPKSYKLRTDTATVTGGSLTFIASNGSANIFFSEQPLPKGINLQNFYAAQIPNSVTIHTSYGDAAVGHFANVPQLAKEHTDDSPTDSKQTTVASLGATNTWILITAPAGFSTSQMQQIVRGLRY
jgi:hypothetical protein